MPQTNSAAKHLRVSDRRRTINDRWRKAVREALHGLRDAMAKGEKAGAQTAYLEVASALDRAARRNIIPRQKAARRKSRLQMAVNKLK